MVAACAFLLAISIDYFFGELHRFHPLVGFGSCVSWIERKINSTEDSSVLSFTKGIVSWCLVTLVPLIVCFAAYVYFPRLVFFFDVTLLYFAVGYKSLRDHVKRIYTALIANDLTQAKVFTSHIVSRDTENMTVTNVRKAALESLLENGSDAIFAPIFWFVLFGGPGVLLYRLANTLDAMWGYKSKRFLYFGKFSAHVDDFLNWVPARLVAFSYVLLGDFRQGWRCWMRQAKFCASPNAGPVMAAGAGALGLKLGGSASYHGLIERRPVLGKGRSPEDDDIIRALSMVKNTLKIWVVVVVLFYFVRSYFS